MGISSMHFVCGGGREVHSMQLQSMPASVCALSLVFCLVAILVNLAPSHLHYHNAGEAVMPG
jgi:hypothetical protein